MLPVPSGLVRLSLDGGAVSVAMRRSVSWANWSASYCRHSDSGTAGSVMDYCKRKLPLVGVPLMAYLGRLCLNRFSASCLL